MKSEKMRIKWVDFSFHSLIHSFPFISFNKIKFISWNSAKEFIHQRDFRLFSIFSHCFIFQQCSNILIVSNYCYNTLILISLNQFNLTIKLISWDSIREKFVFLRLNWMRLYFKKKVMIFTSHFNSITLFLYFKSR